MITVENKQIAIFTYDIGKIMKLPMVAYNACIPGGTGRMEVWIQLLVSCVLKCGDSLSMVPSTIVTNVSATKVVMKVPI